MLLLCLTGLPLIFAHEIDHLLGNEVEAPEMPANTPFASMDKASKIKERQLAQDAPSLMVACGLAMRRFDP